MIYAKYDVAVGLDDFNDAFAKVMQSQASLLLRMRLECGIHDAQGHRVKRFENEGVLDALCPPPRLCIDIRSVRQAVRS